MSFGSVKGPKRANRLILWFQKVEKKFCDFAITTVKSDTKF